MICATWQISTTMRQGQQSVEQEDLVPGSGFPGTLGPPRFCSGARWREIRGWNASRAVLANHSFHRVLERFRHRTELLFHAHCQLARVVPLPVRTTVAGLLLLCLVHAMNLGFQLLWQTGRLLHYGQGCDLHYRTSKALFIS